MTNQNLKKIIIVGAGISGLSSGIYGQKNGYITEIYEKNPVAGGLCTAWKRKGMNIDGCIHWLTGTNEGTEINGMWHDVNAFNKEDIIFPTDFGTIEFEGKQIVLWCDLKKLEKELIEISPEDTKLIKKTIKLIIKFQNMPLPVDIPISTMSLWRFIKIGFEMIPYLKDYLICSKIQQKDYAKKFKSPILKYAFERVVPGEGNLYTTLYAFGTVAVGNGGVPIGGSKTIINNMVHEYENVGGKINYNSEVKAIIIEDGVAKGVELTNGEKIYSDFVITALDSIEVVNKLLNSHYHVHGFEKRISHKAAYPTQSCVLITFSVDKKKIDNLNITHSFEFSCNPITVGASEFNSIKIRNYSYDEKTFVIGGKTTMNVLIPQSDSDYEYWNKLLSSNKNDYYEAKNKLAETIKNIIIKRFPTIEESIEILDVATPMTFIRYTHAYHGAYMPFAYTSKGSMFYYSGKVKGIKNLHLSGQWAIMPGGLPIALMTGKFAIQRILKKEHRWFVFNKKIKYIYK